MVQQTNRLGAIAATSYIQLTASKWQFHAVFVSFWGWYSKRDELKCTKLEVRTLTYKL
jgi:hypothetical protein